MRSSSVKQIILIKLVLISFVLLGCQISPIIPRLADVGRWVKGMSEKFSIGSRLDKETLDQLSILWPGDMQMQPGKTRQLALGIVECCYAFEPVEAKVVWRVEPSDGAEIDEDGLLSISETVPHGSVFTVFADVEKGRRIISTNIFIYTNESNPLVGVWREQAVLDCESDELVEPKEQIEELVFEADGTFQVTWMPFEIYHDYWGTYTFDLESGELWMTVTGGNYVPDDFDGSGTFLFEGVHDLFLRDLWLGTSEWVEGIKVSFCGHHFIGR